MIRSFHVSARTVILWLLWIAGLSVAVAVRLVHIDVISKSNDEGAYLMWARLVAVGYPLYRQTYSVSAPLFIEMLAAVFRIFGFGLAIARLTIMLSFIGTAGVMSWLSHRMAGWTGAFVSLGLLAFIPHFFRLSREVMAEMPATFLAVGAVALAFRYYLRGGRSWLVFAGILLAASGMMKALYPAAVLPIGIFIIFRDKNWRRIIADGIVFGVAVLAALALIVVWYPWDAFFSQAIQFRSDLRATFPLNVPLNMKLVIGWFRPIWGVWVLAAMGFSVSARTARGWAWMLWLLGALAVVVWHTPLFEQHLISVLPPVVLLGIECVGLGVRYWQENIQSPKRWVWVAVLVFPLLNVPANIQHDRKILDRIGGGREESAIQLLKTVTRPTDFVISDSLALPFLADRLTPPPMGDIAFVAIQSGHQTSARLIALSEHYNVQATVAWVGRMVWLPDYLDWAEENFYVHREWDSSHQMYFGRRPRPNEPIPNETTIGLGDSIRFRGFSVDTADTSAGQTLPLTLYWQTTQPLSADYTVFVQMLDASGVWVAGYDSQPIYEYYPTTRWQPGELIADRRTIQLPADLPAGEYTLITGMYHPKTMERLSVENNPQNYIQLTTITVK